MSLRLFGRRPGLRQAALLRRNRLRLLLDTHIVIWAIARSRQLPGEARRLLEDSENTAFVSSISLVEIAIKHRDKPADMDMSAAEALRLMQAAGFRMLPLTPEHSVRLDDLPLLHRDPFDRMLVAQALAEPMRLLTADAQVARYTELAVLA